MESTTEIKQEFPEDVFHSESMAFKVEVEDAPLASGIGNYIQYQPVQTDPDPLADHHHPEQAGSGLCNVREWVNVPTNGAASYENLSLLREILARVNSLSTNVEEMHSEMRKQGAKINDLYKKFLTDDRRPMGSRGELPLNSLEEWDAINQFIGGEDANCPRLERLRAILLLHFQTEKEKTAKLRQIFSAKVLNSANWTGAGGKRRLSGDPLVEFIAQTWEITGDRMAMIIQELKRKNANARQMSRVRQAKRMKAIPSDKHEDTREDHLM